MWRVVSFILLFPLLSFHAPDEGIKISVTNLRNNKGHVLISLYRNGEGFPDNTEKAIRKAKLVIKDKVAWVLFTGLPTGKYAAAILHDENDDQKMNKTFLGLPKEGYGFSNNVMGTFGPPSFSKAAFNYNSGGNEVAVAIRTRY
jgi:uncharacterized protein (DUF2141 family)